MRSNEAFTQRAENALEHAHAEAAALGHSFVGSEHLLLGILSESDAAVERIAAEGGGKDGARPLRRAVRRLIEDPVAELLLSGGAGEGALTADVEDGEFVLRRTAEG